MKQIKDIRIYFEEDTKYGKFSDALYFNIEPLQTEVNSLIQERIDKYVANLGNPPKVIEPTKAELQEKFDAITLQIVELENEKVELLTKITQLPLAVIL